MPHKALNQPLGKHVLNIAVMQPYLFPYIGYFHLIDSVDIFVCFDDVNFIKKGWINRNNILLGGKAHLWSLPLIKKSQNKLINQHEINKHKQSQADLVALIEVAYHQAPYYKQVMPLICEVLNGSDHMIDKLARRSLETICDYLKIGTIFKNSSDLDKDMDADAQTRIIQMVKTLGGDGYRNAIGGKDLYSKEEFARAGIHLAFIESDPIVYKQFDKGFIPCLSILDVLMFNSREQSMALTKKYKLI